MHKVCVSVFLYYLCETINDKNMTDFDTWLESPAHPIGLDYSLIDDIVIDGIDHKDYPDYCDAYISNATYDGKPMNDEQLDIINDDSMFVHKEVMKYIF